MTTDVCAANISQVFRMAPRTDRNISFFEPLRSHTVRKRLGSMETKFGELWLRWGGRGRMKEGMRLQATLRDTQRHASGSSPTKFEGVSANVVSAFCPAYWSFSLGNLNFFIHALPSFWGTFFEFSTLQVYALKQAFKPIVSLLRHEFAKFDQFSRQRFQIDTSDHLAFLTLDTLILWSRVPGSGYTVRLRIAGDKVSR